MELVQKLTSTRAGTIAVAGLAALLAGAAILVYLSKYRSAVDTGGAPVTVLVAKKTIPKGTPGIAIAASGLFTTATIRESQLRDGAFSDPASFQGRIAAHAIYPGQQLTSADFVGGATSLAAGLTKDERLITLPIDNAHGLIGQVEAGDHVDVFAGFNVVPLGPNGMPTTGQARPMLRMVMQNVPVAAVAGKSSGLGATSTSSVTLQTTPTQAEELAFSSDNGKLWFVLRPASGAKLAKPGLVTVETMLLGIPPITVLHSLGGHG